MFKGAIPSAPSCRFSSAFGEASGSGEEEDFASSGRSGSEFTLAFASCESEGIDFGFGLVASTAARFPRNASSSCGSKLSIAAQPENRSRRSRRRSGGFEPLARFDVMGLP